MLSDQEQEDFTIIIRDNRIDIFSVLISRRVFEDYNKSIFRGQNYYQFGINQIERVREIIDQELTDNDDELKKTILGLYISLAELVQQKSLNE